MNAEEREFTVRVGKRRRFAGTRDAVVVVVEKHRPVGQPQLRRRLNAVAVGVVPDQTNDVADLGDQIAELQLFLFPVPNRHLLAITRARRWRPTWFELLADDVIAVVQTLKQHFAVGVRHERRLALFQDVVVVEVEIDRPTRQLVLFGVLVGIAVDIVPDEDGDVAREQRTRFKRFDAGPTPGRFSPILATLGDIRTQISGSAG